jgi:hypothetical protein
LLEDEDEEEEEEDYFLFEDDLPERYFYFLISRFL